MTGLRWDQVDLKDGLLHVARLKRGMHQPVRFAVPSCAHFAPESAGKTKTLPTSSLHCEAVQ
jgi:hypothetical protein